MTAPAIRDLRQRSHLAPPDAHPAQPADRGDGHAVSIRGARDALGGRERAATVQACGPVILGLSRDRDARAIRQLHGMHRAPLEYRSPVTLPLTHLGWAVAFGMCGLLMLLTALVLLVLR